MLFQFFAEKEAFKIPGFGWLTKAEVHDDNYNEICQTMQDMEKIYGEITLLALTRQMTELAAAKGRDAYNSPYLEKNVSKRNFNYKLS